MGCARTCAPPPRAEFSPIASSSPSFAWAIGLLTANVLLLAANPLKEDLKRCTAFVRWSWRFEVPRRCDGRDDAAARGVVDHDVVGRRRRGGGRRAEEQERERGSDHLGSGLRKRAAGESSRERAFEAFNARVYLHKD